MIGSEIYLAKSDPQPAPACYIAYVYPTEKEIWESYRPRHYDKYSKEVCGKIFLNRVADTDDIVYILNHELLHLLLIRIGGDKLSRKLDNIDNDRRKL